MNLTSLYYFVELAKELHVTNTAQKLYISQQNLSQHIQRLEQYYGVTLFHRKPKLALTYAGEQLFAAAVELLAKEHELENRMNILTESRAGNLKLGIPGYRGLICLPHILPGFYEKWPNVSISLINETSGRMEEMLLNGELDLFIGIKYQDDPRLEITTILNDYIYLICSDELLKKCYPDSWEELKRQAASGADLSWFSRVPFLLPKQSMRLRRSVDQCFKEANMTPHIFLESSETELFISLYPNHFGAFFCTQMRLPMFLEQFPDANAFPVKFKDKLINHRLVLACHRERFLPEYATDFIAMTKSVFAEIARTRP